MPIKKKQKKDFTQLKNIIEQKNIKQQIDKEWQKKLVQRKIKE